MQQYICMNKNWKEWAVPLRETTMALAKKVRDRGLGLGSQKIEPPTGTGNIAVLPWALPSGTEGSVLGVQLGLVL